MTANFIRPADIKGPFTPLVSQPWNAVAAGLPGLRSFLQVSADSWRVGGDGKAGVFDRKRRQWWNSSLALVPGALGPILKPFGSRACLEWAGANNGNPLVSPSDFTLSSDFTIIICADVRPTGEDRTLFASSSDTGNYVRVVVGADGAVELVGASGVIASTGAATLPDSPILVMASVSSEGARISLNGTIGGTTGAYYAPSSAAALLGKHDDDDALDSGNRMFAAIVLDVDIHKAVYDASRASFVIATGQAFGSPFAIEWNPLLLGSKLRGWWNADDLAAGAVAAWADRIASFTVSQGTGANQPNLGIDSFNGKAGVGFDGFSDYLQNGGGNMGLLPVGSTPGEIHVSCENQADGSVDLTSRAILAYGAAGTNTKRVLTKYYFSTPLNRMAANNATTTVYGAQPFDGYALAGGVFGPVQKSYLNAAKTGEAAATQNTNSARIRFGAEASSSVSSYWNGQIRDIAITLDLTDDERFLLQGWQAWDAGLQNLLADGNPYKNATFV